MFEVERREDQVVRVKLNRPKLHNAFNEEMIQELTKTFEELSKDSSIRMVTIEGKGPSFCAGADLNWMKKMKDYSQEENIEDSKKLAAMFDAINNCPHPVMAKVHGAVLGGGTGIIACCDYVMSTHLTKYAFSEVRLGLVPAVISPYVMAKIGHSNARAYFISGKKFTAERALSMGLIHEVMDSDEINDRFEKNICRFLEAGPAAAKAAKQLIFKVEQALVNSKDPKEVTCKTIADIRVTDEAQEGMQALLDKRKPNWMNKNV